MVEGEASRRLTAIVADDHDLFRIALSAILRRQGFADIVETDSLDAALERLGARDDVGLALFDLDMPGMNGAASLAAVRECFPGVKVVIVSASSSRSDILAGLAAGVHGYVQKGSSAAALSEAIARVLEGTIVVPASLAELPARPSPAAGDPVRAPEPPPPSGSEPSLTPRQRDVLEKLVEGRSNREIAQALGLGLGTVKVHVAGLLRALDVPGRSAAAAAGSRLLATQRSESSR